MRHEKTVKSTKVIVNRTCDICGKGAGNDCQHCGRDVCGKCRVFWENDPWTGMDYGDYLPRVCVDCDELAKPFADLAEKINVEAEEKIEVLEAEWKAKCEALKNNSA